MRHPTRVILIFATVAALVLPFAFPRVLLAAETANCQDAFTNRWRGVAVQSLQKHGASALVTPTTLAFCDNPGLIEIDGTFYFSNVVPNGGGFNDIVQVGYGKCRSGSCSTGDPSYYFSWGRTNSTPGCSGYSSEAPIAVRLTGWTNANHYYAVLHMANEWRFFIDGTSRTYAPESWICWTGGSAVWFGETWDIGDQMGGVPTNKLTASELAYTNVEGTTWIATNLNAANACNYGGSGAPYFCDITGTRTLKIWTDR
jgi:hypothetical protein